MFNNSTSAVERVRRAGSHSSGTAKLVNMDVWYATTLWLALLSGWIDPSSGRRTRKNPTGGILMKPIMPPALLTPQTLDDSYYYDQGGPPIPHPGIGAPYPYQSQAYDSSPQRPRFWRSIDEPNMQTRSAKDNSHQFPSAFGQQKLAQIRNANIPSQRFPSNFPYHPFAQLMDPQIKGTGPRLDEDSPGSQLGNRNPFNQAISFNRGNPFSKPDQVGQDNPLRDGDSMADGDFGFGPTHEFSGRQRRQPSRQLTPSFDNPWEPISRYGPLRRPSPKLLGNMGNGEGPFDHSDSLSEEFVDMVPNPRKGVRVRSMIPRRGQINYPFPQRPINQRFQQRPLLPVQYGLENPDYFENRHLQKVQKRPLALRTSNVPSHSRGIANVEEFSGEGNNDELLKLPSAEKQVKSEQQQQPEDEFVVESEEHSNVTTGKPVESTGKETKSSETSEESKNVEDSQSSEESTTKKPPHKSKGQHEHKHKEAVAVVTETDEVKPRHGHSHSHHSSRSKVKSNESLEDDSQHGSSKKRRPRTTLATDFNVEEKKEVVADKVAVDAKQS